MDAGGSRGAAGGDPRHLLRDGVGLGVRVAARANATCRQRKLSEYAAVLERSRLVREDTLCHESLTAAERKWLRENRPAEARHWNLLTGMRVENLVHGAA